MKKDHFACFVDGLISDKQREVLKAFKAKPLQEQLDEIYKWITNNGEIDTEETQRWFKEMSEACSKIEKEEDS